MPINYNGPLLPLVDPVVHRVGRPKRDRTKVKAARRAGRRNR